MVVGEKKMLINQDVLSEENNLLAGVHTPVLKVMGLGGGGCNAIERMMEFNLRGVEFIAANTDHQILQSNPAPVKIQLGPHATRGLGAGGDPRVGRAAAEESRKEIEDALSGADMVFLTAGMGGGTGTGAISVAAEVARDLGATVIAIVTTPFLFEMGKRQKNAREGLDLLRKHTHTLVTIPNDRLIYVAPRNLPMEVAFRLADDVLRQSVQGISELIYEPGLINVDYAHVQRLTRLGGGALMSIGQGSGDQKIYQAIEQALHHPLLENISIENAAGIIANFTGGDDLTLAEVDEALSFLHSQAGPDTEIVMGVTSDPQMTHRVQVILMITGLGAPTLEETLAGIAAPVPSREKAPQPEPIIPAQPSNQLEAVFPISRQDSAVRDGNLRSSERKENFSPTNLDVPAFLRRRPRAVASS